MIWGPHPLRWLESVVLVVAALGWTVWHIGWPVLNPLETRWMHDGDWELTYNAWLLFIRGPWTLQPGAIPALLYPYGIPVFYNAVVFWVGLVGKLAAPFVAAEFQLYGAWLVACFVGQALAYRWALEKAGVGGFARVAGALLGLMDPVLAARFGHLALMGHAVLAVQLGCALWAARSPAESLGAARASVAWAVFTVGLDGYLAAQAIPLSVAVLLIAGRGRWRSVAPLLGALVAGVVAMLWATGAIPAAAVDPGAEGFGQFSADPLALFNSQGSSTLVPGFAAGPRQGEGFGYLGAGGLFALGAALVGAIGQRRRLPHVARRVWPVVAMALALFVYAWSSVVMVAGRVVLDLGALYAPLHPLTNAFRGSGRFVWPVHALTLLGALVLVARSPWPRLLRAGVLVAALALQLAEKKPPRPPTSTGPMPELSAVWNGAGAVYRHLAIVPPQVQWVCPYNPEVVGRLTRVAAREGLTINSGHVGRVPYGFASQCGAPFVGPLDPDTLYVTGPEHVRDPGFAAASCGSFDGLVLCVDARRVRDGRPGF
ncbi:MAG: hypothetical protein JNG84_07870 [Archangium sp.]|nr:hypothetical protein [Archangium sp.]